MDAELGQPGSTAVGTDRGTFARRLSTETKAAYKTTEFAVYAVVFVGILLASFLVTTDTRPTAAPFASAVSRHVQTRIAGLWP